MDLFITLPGTAGSTFLKSVSMNSQAALCLPISQLILKSNSG